jgi:hypothetical protein
MVVEPYKREKKQREEAERVDWIHMAKDSDNQWGHCLSNRIKLRVPSTANFVNIGDIISFTNSASYNTARNCWVGRGGEGWSGTESTITQATTRLLYQPRMMMSVEQLVE